MLTRALLASAAPDRASLDHELVQEPAWRWANPVTGDPLLRADDKDFHQLAGHPDDLAAVVSSINDAGTRAEIRAHAERRCQALAEQLSDALALHLDTLAPAAERELADQRTYLALIAEPN
jgi:hypothetical protein